jgi:hypothetical protein
MTTCSFEVEARWRGDVDSESGSGSVNQRRGGGSVRRLHGREQGGDGECQGIKGNPKQELEG